MTEEKTTHGKTLAKWNFPEFIKHQRSKSWYFWTFIIVAFFLIYALVTVNFLFAVIVILGTIIILSQHRYEPAQITFSITEDGLQIEEKFIDYEEIKDFRIIYKPPEVKNLYFEFKSILKPRLNIPLENQNPVEIRQILAGYLQEDSDKTEEPFSESLRKILKL